MTEWVTDDRGSGVHKRGDACGVRGCRPVVVIDPENCRGVAIEVAQSVCSALHVMPGRDISAGIEAALDALREFAAPTPPRPDEPQGLGAVVEDAKGRLHIRTVLPTEEDDVYGKPWSEGPVRRHWQIVDAVRVLSEGVTP